MDSELRPQTVHVHEWRYDTSFVGFMGETFYVYHCDAHDPPMVRTVGAGNGWYPPAPPAPKGPDTVPLETRPDTA